MSEPLGHIVYRAASILAALVVLFAAFNFVDNISNGEPMVPLPALALALIIWLIGLGCRYYRLFVEQSEYARHQRTVIKQPVFRQKGRCTPKDNTPKCTYLDMNSL